MSVERVLQLVRDRGVATDAVVVGVEPDVVPQAPSHRWVLVPMSDRGFTLGGMDRGRFSVYGRYGDEAEAADALVHVARRTENELSSEEMAELSRTARDLAERLKARPAGATYEPTDIPVGTALDHIGYESGHVLFLLDTPFAERSSPPTDLRLPRTGYVLRQALPPGARVERVVPWFGQPGGGVMVGLDRPIRYYCDLGLLDRFGLSKAAGGPSDG